MSVPDRRTTQERVSDWWAVYSAIKAELSPEALRTLQRFATPQVTAEGEQQFDPATINLGMNIARMVTANDRMAALAAAILTSNMPYVREVGGAISSEVDLGETE